MPGGSSKDRRKYGRLRADLSKDLAVEFVARNSAQIRPEKTRRFSIGAAIGLTIAIASIPGIIYSVKPRFSFSPQASLDPDDLLGTPFVVRNVGTFDATDVNIRCELGLDETGYNHITMKNVGILRPVIPRLLAGGPGATISCKNQVFQLPGRLRPGERFTIMFAIYGKYGYSWPNWKIQNTYTYLGFGKLDGSVTFLEQP
jgi:hypothetical protein